MSGSKLNSTIPSRVMVIKATKECRLKLHLHQGYLELNLFGVFYNDLAAIEKKNAVPPMVFGFT